jgi:DNA (cytosine-5)-methyltransferase 1
MRELILDSFACGGGASTGIEMALGRSPDIAVNHDRIALAMHRVNHPLTRHMLQDVATVDAVGMCAGAPIGMLWMSPDCTDHSKAKGAAPRRDGDRTTRGIGWAIFGWVKALPKWQRPRVIFLENVEEYVDWGPLMPDGKRCPKRKGETFKAFVAAWRKLGFVVEWRERRAWWSGSATIRKRLFMVMRRDGEPIVWPERLYGDPGKPEDAKRIAAGELKPWPIVADCIDFSLPIPSILDSAAEVNAKLGLTAKRPLAFNTEARIAKGVLRRVLQRRPFLIKVNHTGYDYPRDRGIDQPLGTMTATRDDALVAPILAYAQQGGGTRPVDAPAHTFTASPKDQNVVIAASMMTMRNSGQPDSAADRPARTFMANGAAEMLVAGFMAQHAAGSWETQPSKPLDAPLSTLTKRGTQQNLVALSMLTLRGSDRREADADAPMRTDSASGQHHALVGMPLMTAYYGSETDGPQVDAPMRTDTVRDRFGLVSALAGVPPFSAEHEAKARQVAEFLRRYGCWDGGEFVSVVVDGVTLVLVDICMRMLTPRERYNANGFPRDYIIDHGIDEDGKVIRFTLEQQGSMCGNAVCPTEARDLVAANYQPRDVVRPGKPAEPVPMFLEAAE